MLEHISKGKDVTYKSHSTQINLSDCSEDGFNIFYLLQQEIPDEKIYREHNQISDPLAGSSDHPKEQYGYESIPHITLLYGIENAEDYFILRKALKNFGPIEFEIGEVSSFRRDETPYDVLITKIISKPLEEIHKAIKENLDNNYKFSKYQPHMTLAYVKKGECKDLEGRNFWTGTKYVCSRIQFSHIDKFFLEIPL